MKTLAILAVVLSLAAGPASAGTAHYWLIDADNATAYIADSGTLLTLPDGRRRIWTWLVTGAFSDSPAQRSSEEGLVEVDCAARTLAEVSWVKHDGSGNVSGSGQPIVPQIKYAAPRTWGANLVDFVCADPGERSRLAMDLASVGSDPVLLGEAAVELARENGSRTGSQSAPSASSPAAVPSPIPEERNVPKYFSPQP
ncbi:MAG: hypothetical protein ACRED8_12360 [Caulobacteraceae bacterium]